MGEMKLLVQAGIRLPFKLPLNDFLRNLISDANKQIAINWKAV
jgi:hypothetical protein